MMRTSGEASAVVCERVIAARGRQHTRLAGTGAHCNGQMTAPQVRDLCKPEPEAKALLEQAVDRLGISARAYDRVLKVARTIADLSSSTPLTPDHIAEAIQYRSLDRHLWM